MTTAKDMLARLQQTRNYSEKDYAEKTPTEYKLLIAHGYNTASNCDESGNRIIFLKRIYLSNDDGQQTRAYTIEASIYISPINEQSSIGYSVVLDSAGEKQTKISFSSDFIVEAEQRIEKFFDALGRPFYGD